MTVLAPAVLLGAGVVHPLPFSRLPPRPARFALAVSLVIGHIIVVFSLVVSLYCTAQK